MRVLAILLLIAAAVCASPRSATRTQPITGRITSLTDKDARSKARVHPAFANAGRVAGVEIWRIQDFEPTPVASTDFGKFYKGDSYIVLKTTADKRNNLSWNIHYWIGSESTADESGAAAILTVGLDDKFNGAAVQYREPLGQESQLFKGYFPSALQYLNGGHASGFNHVVTNAGAEKRLIQVKGKRNIRTRQEKTEAMTKAQALLSAKNYPSWVHVVKIPQGTEPAVFKQYFTTWRDDGMSHSRIV